MNENSKQGIENGESRFSIFHVENGNVGLSITASDDTESQFNIAAAQLPGVLYAMAGGTRADHEIASAHMELENGGVGDIVNKARAALLALVIHEEKAAAEAAERAAAAESEIVEANIVDYLDDMSRDELLAFAKETRDQSTPAAMAKWAVANPGLVQMLTYEPGTPVLLPPWPDATEDTTRPGEQHTDCCK